MPAPNLHHPHKPVSVGVVADEPIPRAALTTWVSSQSSLTLAGSFSPSDLAALDCISPDVVLLHTATMSRSAVQSIKSIHRPSRIVVLCRETLSAAIRGVFAAGAAGYVSPAADSPELLDAIWTVSRGRRYIDPNLKSSLIDDLRSRDLAADREPSKRELQVLKMLAYGYSNREIALLLRISHKSVDSYRARLAHKLELRSRAEIVRYALSMGLFADIHELETK